MVFTATTVEDYSKAQDIDQIMAIANKTDQMLEEIIHNIRPGMKESEAEAMALNIYRDYGVTRSWHKPYIRFGTNTTLTYMDVATEDLVLQEEDIAFLDIGPIFDEMEGDSGKTIVFGENELFLDLKNTSEKIFDLGRQYFQEENPTGPEMYGHLSKLAQDFGYEFNLHTSGHLIGLFSHSGCGVSGGMKSYEGHMQPGLWILEVQIRHPEKPYGAFYERVMI